MPILPPKPPEGALESYAHHCTAHHCPPLSSAAPTPQWVASTCAATPDLRAPSAPYCHPLVRDIAWLLGSPDLMLTPGYPRPTLQTLGLVDDGVRHQWLTQLEQHPQTLEATVDECRHYRLGRYHELLWQFVLRHAPSSQLLVSNLKIEEKRITLGELDLIYQTEHHHAPTHLEVAIKFYLGLPDGPGAIDSPSRWIGPGGADSLAIKYQRSLRHQLPLAHTPQGRDAITSALEAIDGEQDGLPDGERIRQQLALPGCLFRPWQPEKSLADCLPPPTGCHPETALQAGWWVRVSDFSAFCLVLSELDTPRSSLEQAQVKGIVREKPAWLAAPPIASLVSWRELDAWLHKHFFATNSQSSRPPHPRQLWLELISSTTSIGITAPTTPPTHYQWRVFVVPDDWPGYIPLPPAPKE